VSENTIVFENVHDFSIGKIFECGQAFRWNRENDGSYTGVAGGRAANAAFSPLSKGDCAGRLTIRELAFRASSLPETGGPDRARAFWENYFDLKRDYGEINRILAENDETMARAIDCGAGIRILKQNAWEALISFIISQNNNIPRIKGCVERLCKHFGTRLEDAGGPAFFDFPSISVLASLSEEDLAPCGLGYRARYICATARRVAESGGEAWLNALRAVSSAEARASLTSLCGVGEKVASCVLLFGLDLSEGFPMDVWMKRALLEFYGTDAKEAAGCAAARFGPHAGIAQQYLFHYMRERANRR
jgi:N-glycosylase/DNA lyase